MAHTKNYKVEIVRIFLMLLFLIFISVPFLWIAVTSFKPNDRVMADVAPFSLRTFVPVPFTFEAFQNLFAGGFQKSILITVFVGLTTVFFGVILNSMAGFSFAKFDFPGKRLLFGLVLISFLVPFEAIAVPLYLTIQKLGWGDTIYALIVPALAHGLSIFLFRQFFMGIPSDLVDAAIIDGAGWFKIFWKIFLPISKPAMITAGLLLFLSQWQSFIWPLIAVQSKNLRMVQVAIAYSTAVENVLYWNRFAAAAFLVGIIPLFLIFPLQKYYVRGISTSGLKG